VPVEIDCDQLLKLSEGLRELEVVIGREAGNVVAEVRNRLAAAVARRADGDMPGALTEIRGAMERLVSLARGLDPAEGLLMQAIAERFTSALNLGDKGSAKEAVNFMRHKAGDPKDEPSTDW